MKQLLKPLRPFLLTLCAHVGIFTILEAQKITDPVPPDEFVNEIGVQLLPYATIRNSPNTDSAPRLNMLKESPDGSGRHFVIDQRGYLYAISIFGGVGTPYLDLHDHLEAFYSDNNAFGQDGFSAFAFHPEFATNGLFYGVASVTPESGTPDFFAKRPINPGHGGDRVPPIHQLVIEFQAADPSANTFEGTMRTLFRIEQPYADHNVGDLDFNPHAKPGDPDYGMLYITIADGGNNWPFVDADPENNGQDTSTALGTIFRIDPLGNNSSNGQYGIPPDNPFADSKGAELKEIWSYGHRNNHRLSWDPSGDRALYCFELGQNYIEEVNRIEKGGNYGWGEREGTFTLREDDPTALYPLPEDDASFGYTYPVVQYAHADAIDGLGSNGAISGGFVYRGDDIPQLYGKMIFADFTANSRLMYANVADFRDLGYAEAAPVYRLHVYNADNEESTLSEIIRGSPSVRTDVRLGSDLSGDLYLLNKHNNTIYRIHPPLGAPTFTLDLEEADVDGRGGSIEVAVETEAEADWNLEPLADWLTVEGEWHRTGEATVRIRVAAQNRGTPAREGKVVLAGQEFLVRQEALELPEAYFPEATGLGDDRFAVLWWGDIWFAGWPWIFVDGFGWEYLDPAASSPGSLLFYDLVQESWMFTTPETFPRVYSFGRGTWLMYLENTYEPRWFWNYEEARWMSDEK
jgi:glucose/arabinose dehydrogenase